MENHGIAITTMLPFLKALAWPVATYSCEGCTVKKEDSPDAGES